MGQGRLMARSDVGIDAVWTVAKLWAESFVAVAQYAGFWETKIRLLFFMDSHLCTPFSIGLIKKNLRNLNFMPSDLDLTNWSCAFLEHA